MKRIIPILLILLLLTGCAQHEQGEIIINEESDPLVLKESDEHLLFESREKPDMEFETYYDYYAGFSIPYPKDWIVSAASPNYISIYNSNSMVVIHHKLLAKEIQWDDNVQIFRDSFQSMLDDELFNVAEYSQVFRRLRQSLTELTIVNDEPALISEKYENIKMTTGLGDYISGKMSEKRYYMQYNNINTVISMISTDIDNLDILDYMVSNIRDVGIEYSETKVVSANSMIFVVPSSFRKHEVETEEVKGTVYTPGGSDAFAGCFIGIIPAREASRELMDTTFKTAFPSAGSCTYNEFGEFNYDVGIQGYSYLCTVSEGKGPSITPKGTAWNIEVYEDEGDVVLIGYPLAKAELIRTLWQKNSGE